MWTIDDLKRAVESRNEHLALAPEVEQVILAAERAMGRTEEVYRRDLAQSRLSALIAVLDIETVPDHVRAAYPAIQFPSPGKHAPIVPLPAPAHAFDAKALANLIKETEAGLKVGDVHAPAKAVNLNPQKTKEKVRALNGPSR